MKDTGADFPIGPSQHHGIDHSKANLVIFFDLPTEMIVRTLAFLSLKDLISCQLTNKFLRSLVTSSLQLQYLIEAEAAGVQDNVNSSLPVSERLEELKRSESAWTNFLVKQHQTIAIRHKSSGYYDLTGGVYVLGESNDDGSIPPTSNTLRYAPLTSANDKALEKEWPRIKLEHNIIDFGLAIYEHDLIAVATS